MTNLFAPTTMDGIPSPEDPKSSATQESRAQFQIVLKNSLDASLIGVWWGGIAKTIQWITRRKKPLSFVSTVIILNIVNLIASTGIALLLGESVVTEPAYFLPHIVWGGFTILYVLVMQSQLAQATQILSTTVVGSIPLTEDIVRLQKLFQTLTGFWGQFLFSLLFAVVTGLWVPYVIAVASGEDFLVGDVLVYVVNYFQMGMYIYFLYILIVIVLALSRIDFDIYANDPSTSPTVRRINHASNMLTICVAGLSAIHYLLLSLLRINIEEPLTLTMLILLAWVPPLALYISTHYTLGTIISRVKERRLTQLQKMIRQMEEEGDLTSTEQIDTIKRLMDYHDRVNGTPDSMVNFDSIMRLIASLLLPLTAMILANLQVLAKIFR